MAIYHLHAQIISRTSGRSAIAAAAYRAGENLTNEYDGVQHDFTAKHNIVHTEIMLPEHAPAAYSDRSSLWNSVELSEKNSNAQLAREIEVALPAELSRDEQIELVRNYCQSNFVDEGMCVDFAIHNPPLTASYGRGTYLLDADGEFQRDADGKRIHASVLEEHPEMGVYQNPHAHIMMTLRPIDRDGKWESKSKQQYVCVRDGETRNFTAEEFKTAHEEGWQKQFQYKDGKKKVWLTQEEGNSRGLERVNKFPKTEKVMNETVERWNSKDRIYDWREHWSRDVNTALASIGSTERIDHRSYADQGIDKMPSIHMGPDAMALERRGQETEIGNLNREIKAANTRMQQLRDQLKAMVESAKEVAESAKEKAKAAYEKTAHALESIRARFISTDYKANDYEDRAKSLEFSLRNHSRLDNTRRAEERRLFSEKREAEYRDRIKEVKKELSGLSPVERLLKEGKLKTELAGLQGQIEKLHETDNQIYRGCGFTDAKEVQDAFKRAQKEEKYLGRLEKSLQELQKSQKTDIKEFRETVEQLTDEQIAGVDAERQEIRGQYEDKVREELSDTFGEDFSETDFSKSCDKADRVLKYDSDDGKRSIKESLEHHKEHVEQQKEEDTPEHTDKSKHRGR